MGSRTAAFGFTLFLGALTVLPALAIDMSLPSLPTIQAEFRASAAEVAAVIAIFIAGFSTAPLVVGPLADRFGRKPVMLGGLGLFTVCALGCALAPSIAAVLAFRLFQGVGAGAVGILPRAIIRDRFEGREGRLQLAAVSMVFSVGPLIAPTIGATILAFGNWRTIFVTLFSVGAATTLAAAFFRESQPKDMRRSLRPAAIFQGYRRALTDPMCIGFSFVGGTAFAGLFAYVNTSPLLFMQGLGLSQVAFAGLFALIASGVIVGSTINTWLINRHARPRTVLDVSLSILLAVAIGLIVVSLSGSRSPFPIAALVMIYISTFGLVFPNVVHESIQPLPEIAGIASAVVQSIQMLFGAVGGIVAASLYRDGSPFSIALVMTVGSVGALALYFGWLRRKVED
jgi:MFS transporter, DHA1 family, multidrug resistance protein